VTGHKESILKTLSHPYSELSQAYDKEVTLVRSFSLMIFPWS